MSEDEEKRIADRVLAELKPILEDIAKRLPDDGELSAINKGVGATLELESANALKLERLETAARNSADNFTSLVEEVRGYHTRTIDQYDKLGARVHRLEERSKPSDNDETRLAERGGE